jgi:hypothetical protein
MSTVTALVSFIRLVREAAAARMIAGAKSKNYPFHLEITTGLTSNFLDNSAKVY